MRLPWIDTHCHLDAAEFDGDRDAVLAATAAAGVEKVVIPAVNTQNFASVSALAERASGGRFALGIHPLCSATAGAADLERLDAALSIAHADPRLVAVGEIGIDLFVEAMKSEQALKHQEWLFDEQIKIALDHDLPVLVHIRRAQDRILKVLRKHPGIQGFAHAFNGSQQQAEMFIDLGFKLGIGGAMTFDRALNIRRIAKAVPLDALVLETDSPDISPAWLYPGRNTPAQIPAIGQALAELRGIELEEVAVATARSAHSVLRRM